MMTSISTASNFFKTEPWPNFLTNIHGGTFILKSCHLYQHTETCQLICFIKSNDWSLYVMIFSVNLWLQLILMSRIFTNSSILLFILSYSLKNLGGPFWTTNNHFTWLSSFFCIQTFLHQSFGNIWFNVWAISLCQQ